MNEITVQQADPSSFESHQIIALDEIKSAILLAKILSKNKIRLLLTTFLVNSVFANALHGENIDLIQCLEEAEIENLSALTKVTKSSPSTRSSPQFCWPKFCRKIKFDYS